MDQQAIALSDKEKNEIIKVNPGIPAMAHKPHLDGNTSFLLDEYGAGERERGPGKVREGWLQCCLWLALRA